MSTKLDFMLGLSNKVPVINPAALGIFNTLNQYQSQMETINSSWVQHITRMQETIAPIHEHISRMAETFSGIQSIALQRQQEFARIGSEVALPLSRLQLQMNEASKANMYSLTKLSSILGAAQTDWIKTTTAYIDAMKPLTDIANRWDSQISAALRSLHGLQIGIPSKIDIAALKELSLYASEYGYNNEDVEIADDGTLVIAGEAIIQSEIEHTAILETLNRLNDTIAAQNELIKQQNSRIGSQEETINTLLKEVRKLKDSRLKRFLTNIILPIILGILVGNFISPILQPYSDLPVQQIKKMMKTAATSVAIASEELENYRYVTLDNLKLWEGSRMKSRTLARLKLGDVVRVLRKKRNWTYVLFIDRETSEPIAGWTLTRYLETFRNN